MKNKGMLLIGGILLLSFILLILTGPGGYWKKSFAGGSYVILEPRSPEKGGQDLYVRKEKMDVLKKWLL